MHIHISEDCLIYCILSNGEVIKYHKFISVVVIELSVRCLNTGPEDRLPNLWRQQKRAILWHCFVAGVPTKIVSLNPIRDSSSLGNSVCCFPLF